MKKHPRNVKGYNGTLKELAQAIGNMTYDRTAEFLDHLAADLERQAEGDLGRNRPILASHLYATAEDLRQAKAKIDDAWKICEPHTRE